MLKKLLLIALSCQLHTVAFTQEANRNSIVFSNDGILFACTYESGAVEVHDITTGKKVFNIAGKKKYEFADHINSLSFSPDKKYFAIASVYQLTKVYDLSTGKEIGALDVAEKVLFTGTGKIITIREKQLTIYSSAGFVKEKTIVLPDIVSDDANPCTVDAISDKIIVPLFYSDYAIVDAANGDVLSTHKENSKGTLRSIQVSNDARAVITCSDSILKIFSISTGALRFKLAITCPGYTVPRACLTQTDMLYTGSIDGESIRCIDIRTGLLSEREGMNFTSGYRMRGVYFAPRLAICAISYSAPYKKKATFSFLDVVTREDTRIFLQ